jgi:hypothetical protein
MKDFETHFKTSTQQRQTHTFGGEGPLTWPIQLNVAHVARLRIMNCIFTKHASQKETIKTPCFNRLHWTREWLIVLLFFKCADRHNGNLIFNAVYASQIYLFHLIFLFKVQGRNRVQPWLTLCLRPISRKE